MFMFNKRHVSLLRESERVELCVWRHARAVTCVWRHALTVTCVWRHHACIHAYTPCTLYHPTSCTDDISKLGLLLALLAALACHPTLRLLIKKYILNHISRKGFFNFFITSWESWQPGTYFECSHVTLIHTAVSVTTTKQKLFHFLFRFTSSPPC